ncbi:MAG TPA: hypothetical protein VH082_00865 [Rudaea sp.]|jgi:hypothetical protein|nr:hypothetical protein [Rudaea sp.]
MVSRLTVCLIFSFAACVCVRAQSTLWSNAWYTTGQPGLTWNDATAVRTTNGQIVTLSYIYGWGQQVTSMTPAGVVNWQIDIGDMLDSGYVPVAGADGSVFIHTSGAMTKIDSSGHVVWYRNNLGIVDFVVSANSLYVASCKALASLDIDTGATQWSVDRDNASSCSTSLGTDTAGAVYLASQVDGPASAPISPVRLTKFDAAGSTQWDFSIQPTTNWRPQLLGVAGGHVYIQQGTSVAAYDAVSGSSLWVRAQMYGLFVAGLPGSPIVSGDGGMSRLDPADGHTDWTSSSVDITARAMQGDDAYLCSFGIIQKFNATTGAYSWSFTPPFFSSPCFALLVDSGSVIAESVDLSTGAIRFDAIDASTGNATGTDQAASTQQGLVEYDSFVDNGHIVQTGKVLNTTNYHLRSVDAISGAVDWDVAFSPPLPGWGPELAHSADSIIVADYSADGTGYASDYWLASFARSDGSLRWSKVEQEYAFDQEISTEWASTPQTDSRGNVFFSRSESGACYLGNPQECYSSTLMKLAAADGSVLWHFDGVDDNDIFFDGLYSDAPPFTLIGDDVLVAGNFSGSLAGQNIVRLSGIDGSVMWSAAPFTSGGSSYVAVNPEGTITLTNGTSRALLQASGAVLWIDHPTLPCSSACMFFGSAQLADGTQLYAGTDYDISYANNGWVISQPLIQNAPVRKVPVNIDKPSDVRSWPRQLIVDDATVWLVGSMRQQPYTYVYYLAKLDPVTLGVGDQQVLATNRADVFAPGSNLTMLAAPVNDVLSADINVWGGDLPAASGAASFDTAIAARGDLALALTSADSIDTSAFGATVTYNGDTSVTGVRLTIWHQGYYDAASLICAAAGASNCVISNHSGYVEASFDIQTGGSVTVSGTYPASRESATLYGSVYGPASLAEPTLGNNFGSALIGDLLFRNGFE